MKTRSQKLQLCYSINKKFKTALSKIFTHENKGSLVKV